MLKRYFYSSTIDNFLTVNAIEIISTLTENSDFDIFLIIKNDMIYLTTDNTKENIINNKKIKSPIDIEKGKLDYTNSIKAILLRASSPLVCKPSSVMTPWYTLIA